jgi:rare lipoprotein A
MKQRSITKNIAILGIFILFGLSIFAQSIQKSPLSIATQDTIKLPLTEIDSLSVSTKFQFKGFKKSARASYYANKFNGKKTASGTKFSNEKYTAAHRKLPFGTLVKVTNEANGKSVIVEINDRGPFSRGREIDLSRRAFMEIAVNKNSGSLIVTLQLVEKKGVPAKKITSKKP